jgi:hypothetical protein
VIAVKNNFKTNHYFPAILWLVNCLFVLWLRPYIHEIYKGSRLHSVTEMPYWYAVAVGFACVSIGYLIFLNRGTPVSGISKYIWHCLGFFGVVCFILSAQDVVADI